MANLTQESRNSIALQAEMFRLAEKEHGLSLAVLARTRRIPLSTLKDWRNGAAMPAWALGALHLPDDLATLVLTPYRKAVVSTDDEGAQKSDIDTLGLEANGLAGEIQQARHPLSPGGVRIVPSEVSRIKDRARRVCGQSRSIQ